jgi:hypothetical protein
MENTSTAVRLIVGFGVAAIAISGLIYPLLDPAHWWAGYLLIVSSLVALLLILRRMQGWGQLSNAAAPPLDRPLPNSQQPPVDEVTSARPEARNYQPDKQYVSNELDVQALKEAIKNRRRHFGQ